MTRKKLKEKFISALTPVYGEREAAAIFFIVAKEVYALERVDFALSPNEEIDAVLSDIVLEELVQCRPVQYVLGHTVFCGFDFIVKEGVLVPRPETEELVWQIKNDYAESHPRILDIGTGSGCIAIALARLLPKSSVVAVDISQEALVIAGENAQRNSVDVDFIKTDILAQSLPESLALRRFDVVVSNPPYIPASDKVSMRANVTEYEPHCALFVGDDDPLVFYRAIAKHSKALIVSGGSLYFEIYEHYAEQTVSILEQEGYSDVVVIEDINSKPRMIKCRI